MAELDTWSVTVDDVGHGDRYRFRLDGGDRLADPASRWQPDGVHGPSAVVDEAVFGWHDDAWTGVSLADTVLYELHIGTFTAEGTFDAAIRQLARLAELGITTIEIMPVAAFPGARNWGYDGVFPFAVQESYGGPDRSGPIRRRRPPIRASASCSTWCTTTSGPRATCLPATGRTSPTPTARRGVTRSTWPVRQRRRAALLHRERRRLDPRLPPRRAASRRRPRHRRPDADPFVEELTSAVHDAARAAGRTALVTIESSANDPRIVRSRPTTGGAATPCGTTTCTMPCGSR